MEDINNVTGFDVSSLNFDTYIFGAEYKPEEYKVNYYYPSLEAAETGYWQQPTSNKTYTHKDDWYAYVQIGEQLLYMYSVERGDATSLIRNPNNLEYIFGENGSYEYLVASRSVLINSGSANFYVAGVNNSSVNANYYNLCNSYSDGGSSYEDDQLLGIRPIVVLPSDIEVEENESGQWDIAY